MAMASELLYLANVRCPVVYEGVESTTELRPTSFLCCQKLEVDVNAYLSTANVKLKGQWLFEGNFATDCFFALPTTGTVTSAQVSVSSRDTVQLSAVVCKNKLERQLEKIVTAPSFILEKTVFKDKLMKGVIGEKFVSTKSSIVCDAGLGLFKIPVGELQGGDSVSIVVECTETPCYDQIKGYCLNLPLTFDKAQIKADTQWSDVVTVNGRVPVVGGFQVDCLSHELRIDGPIDDDYRMFHTVKPKSRKTTVESGAADEISSYGRDFEMQFVKSEASTEIGIHAIKRTHESMIGATHVTIFLTPPQISTTTAPRSIFFVLDYSRAMAGRRFEIAVFAMQQILAHVSERDFFNVKMFADNCCNWQRQARPGTFAQKRAALNFIFRKTVSRAQADVCNALAEALEDSEKAPFAPYIVLLTASNVPPAIGPVLYEEFSKPSRRVRLFTLAIGSFGNNMYLKALAYGSRGHFDLLRGEGDVFSKMDHFCEKFTNTSLSDIKLLSFRGADGEKLALDNLVKGETHDKYLPVSPPCKSWIVPDSEQRIRYILRCPDLCANAPLAIAIEVLAAASRLKQVVISGVKPDGETVNLVCELSFDSDPAVDRLMARQKLEYWEVEYWAKNESFTEAVSLAMTHSIPLPSMSTLVCFQMDRAEARDEALLEPAFDGVLRVVESGDEKTSDEKTSEMPPVIATTKRKTLTKKNDLLVGALMEAESVLVLSPPTEALLPPPSESIMFSTISGPRITADGTGIVVDDESLSSTPRVVTQRIQYAAQRRGRFSCACCD